MIALHPGAAALPAALTPGYTMVLPGVVVDRVVAVVVVKVAAAPLVGLETRLVTSLRRSPRLSLLSNRPVPTAADAVPGREAEAAVTAVH